MAERDSNTNTAANVEERRIREKEVRDSIDRVNAIGQSLQGISKIRRLYDGFCDHKVVELTIQQVSDFGCALEVAADTLANYLKEQTGGAKPVRNEPTSPLNVRQPSGTILLEDIAQGLRDLTAIGEALALAHVGAEMNGESVCNLGFQIQNRAQALKDELRKLGNPPPASKVEAQTQDQEKKYHIHLTMPQADEVDKGLREARALAMALVDGQTEEWRQGEAKNLANMILENVTKVEEILEVGRPTAG